MKKLFHLALCVVICCVSCSKDEDNGSTTKVDNRNYPYVDLGLSTYWATYNIGASSPGSPGDIFAFGETSVKSEYTSSNYSWGTEDVATARWGGDWRLPTGDELSELVSQCTWKIVRENGIQVARATGPNGNYILLPFLSYIGDEGYHGWYWSSSTYLFSKAYCLYFGGSEVSSGTIDRYNGFLARAVITNPNYSANVGGNGNGSDNGDNGDNSSSSYEKPDVGFYDFTATKTSLKVQYKIYNKEEAQVRSAKIYYGTSSNPSSVKSASVSGTMITANISGLKAGTTYYVKCVATGRGGTSTTSTTRCTTNY